MSDTNIFGTPKERRLKKSLSQLPGAASNKPQGEPPPMSGQRDPRQSLALNEILADVEASFDAIYLNYPRHTEMQHAMDRVRLHGLKSHGAPMRGLGILGPSGSGKTTGIAHYDAHLRRSRPAEPGLHPSPLLYIRLMAKTTVQNVLRSMLVKFGDSYAHKRRVSELTDQVRNCIVRAGVELIVLDECQHLRNRSNDSLRVTNQFKVFLDESIAPVVFSGTYDARSMFEANPELRGRLANPVDLKPLDPTNAGDVNLLRGFLERLDDELIARDLIRIRSGLSEQYQLAGLFSASEGIIGTAYRIVREALLHSVARGADSIEPYDLSRSVERWAMPNGLCQNNPFRSTELLALL